MTDDIDDQHGEDGASLPGHFPIRVVSQRTGVNSVTLRAWERRYGLLRPVRTPKGHRLYSEDDIARVARILGWIDRGISIGRVRGLLDRAESIEGAGDGSDGAAVAVESGEPSDWQRYTQRLLSATAAFDENRLEDTVSEALSLYPFATVCDRLLNPLGEALAARWRGDAGVPGHAAERAFFDGFLRRKLATRIAIDGRGTQGAPVLLAALPGSVDLLALRTLAIGCIGRELPVLLLEDVLGADELAVVADRRRPAAVLLHGDGAQDPAAFARFLQKLHGAGLVPLAVAGSAARLHEALVREAGAVPLTVTSLAAAVRDLPVSGSNAEGIA